MGWTDMHLKVPDHENWLAVVRVTTEGETELLGYCGDIPADVERELDAIRQRWTLRATWPGDTDIQEGARIRPYHKYAEEAPPEDLDPHRVRSARRKELLAEWIAWTDAGEHPMPVEKVWFQAKQEVRADD